MIILHLAVVEDGMFLWGEAPPEDRKEQSQAGRGTPDNPLYPYDAGPAEMAWALKDLPVTLTRLVMNQKELTAWLPSRGQTPLPSSPMIDDPVGLKGKPRLKPWTIQGFMLSPPDAAALISLAGGRRVISAGIVCGPDLLHWGEVLRLTGAMVARQRYLPDIKKSGPEFHSFWRPVLGDPEQALAADLANRMPPVARAVTVNGSGKPPQFPALGALKWFINLMLDYLVRKSLKVHPGAHFRRRSHAIKGFDSPHDAWLAALADEDPVIRGASAGLAELAVRVRHWARPLAVSASSPYRLCFRLEEPEEADPAAPDPPPDDGWQVRYLLQPRNDPSLQMPLETLWDKKKKKQIPQGNRTEGVKEYALTALGQAAGLCPRIADSLGTAAPSGYRLDDRGAYEFLTQRALSLEQAGFGVMLPAWWAGKQARFRPKTRVTVKSPPSSGSSVFSLSTVVEFDWRVSLGGEVMTQDELEALAALKSPLVRFRGQWVEMRAEEIKTALEAWKKNRGGRATVRDVLQMSLGAKSPAAEFEVEELRADGRLGELLERLEGKISFREEPAPVGFNGTLRPYQQRGYSWLAFLKEYGLGACLADDMGLGKTIQALALVEKERAAGETRPTLLICPTSVVNNWFREAHRFTPNLSVMVHHGADRLKGGQFKKEAGRHALVVSTYGLLQREVRTLQTVEWAGLVLDEAQNIKNPETKQAKAARALTADYRIALTGTPVENHVGDLWSIMEFLNSGFLGAQAEFRTKFQLPIQTGSNPDAVDLLKKITGPFVLRRTKTDKSIISDLPDKIDMKTYCHLTKEQASLYASVVREIERSVMESLGIQRKGLILAALSKLKQVCNHPAHFLGDNSAIAGRSGKLARTIEILDEIQELGEHSLIFTQFREMGTILKRHLQETYGREVLFLHGGTPKGARDRMVDRFQNDADAPPIFVLSLKAGGTGLNLTRANHVFHFDRWWNPAVENQATDRVFRIGQHKNVQVHKMVCLGTLEERIDEMIEGKKEVAERVVGAGENWLTEFSNDELRDLLALRQGAMEV
ncbi:MAG: DEAD/DEAH box helicase [Pseudomonadota bacterium]